MDGYSAQCSLNCDGNSTKSRAVEVPASIGYSASENMPCSAWPNSWNIVVTSVKLIKAGSPSAGFGRLATLYTTGSFPSRRDCSTNDDIHAPPFLLSRLK